MNKLEKILGLSFLIALILKWTLLPGGGILATFTLMILANLYFLFGFALFNQIELKSIVKSESYIGISALRLFGSFATGLALSTLCVGVLFKLQHWPGAKTNIILGLITSLIILIVALVKYYVSKEEIYTRIMKRLIILGGVGIFFLTVSDYSIIKIQFRNHPKYIKAYELYLTNPKDDSLRNNMYNEYQRTRLSNEEFEEYMKYNANQK